LMREFALAEEQYQQDLASAQAIAEKELRQNSKNPLYVPNHGAVAESVASSVQNADTSFVQALNGVLAADGYGALRLQSGTLAADQASLRDVTWMSWGRDGLAETVIRSSRLEFELHRMTRTLVLRFFDGQRVAEGLRTPLPSSGLRLDLEDVSVEGWLKLLPGLSQVSSAVATTTPVQGTSAAVSSSESPVTASATDPIAALAPAVQIASAPLSAKVVRKSLDDLISSRGSFSYYRLNSLGSIDGKLLKMVQINWHDNSGRLVKTIEADTLEVILHPGGSVELLLRNGAFLDGGVKSPFSADRFRLHLPSQDLNTWRNSGVPYTESEH